MKAIPMITVAVLSLTSAVAMAAVGFWPWMQPTPELEFKTRDGQVIASLQLNINNSPAIVDTSTVLDPNTKTATLGFVLIQNPDLYRRSSRRIEVEWQLGTINQNDYSFKLEGSTVSLKTDKLKTLLPDKEANNRIHGIGDELAEP